MLDTLINRRITLVDPRAWTDQNDREVMAKFAESLAGPRVFAYCMSEGSETAHHWQIFADGGKGVRINFSRDRLLAALPSGSGITHSAVSYVQWRELGPSYSVEWLPFVKRSVFRFEKEYRIVAAVTGVPEEQRGYDLPVPLDCITSVYLSGELPEALFETLRDLIARTPGCHRIKVRHSGLLKNVNWSRSLARISEPEAGPSKS